MRLFISKIYLPLFFACAYKFLSFLITACLIFPPLAIFGLALYFFVFLFEIIMYKAVAISSPDKDTKSKLALLIFLLFQIGILVLVWLGVGYMQDLFIKSIQFPAKLFTIVKYFLDTLAIILSFSLYIFQIVLSKKKLTVINIKP